MKQNIETISSVSNGCATEKCAEEKICVKKCVKNEDDEIRNGIVNSGKP